MRKKFRDLRKVLTTEQINWLINYEETTTFEPMNLSEIESGEITFDEAARLNIDWFESWKGDAYNSISTNVPYNNK